MELSRQVLLVCTLWCYLDQVHLIPPPINEGPGPLPFSSWVPWRLPEPKMPECGKSKITGTCTDKLSIEGGHDAKSEQWPWVAALYKKSKKSYFSSKKEFLCAGSLISRNWVITAAHCIPKEPIPKMFVRLNDVNSNNEEKDYVNWFHEFNVDENKIVLHPEYSSSPLKNDIALLRIQRNVTFKDTFPPICVFSGPKYETDEYYENETFALIAGWGQMKEGGDSSNILQEAKVKVVQRKTCATQYNNARDGYVIDENIICAGEKGKRACSNDSGGPLMFCDHNTRRYYLGGITSGGGGCTPDYFPTLFTKVARFISFINDVTGENF